MFLLSASGGVVNKWDWLEFLCGIVATDSNTELNMYPGNGLSLASGLWVIVPRETRSIDTIDSQWCLAQ